ncbi:hypothetical protein ACH4HG_15390 [Streptomyces coeruleorubidus]|uniref:DUF1109 domain-containing protein n=1 Tax=Streptomyces coeruleorubidus TaxID=116188 RepID=A0ABZ0KMW6_STRC4|nr:MULTISPECIES: hypothetical protein [Streptomyces]WOT39238.1 hypothetical protein R5U08_36090 [Streptomyces coeruleorubidus]GGU15633.1 hypothetical protein GCM10010244_47780 [Streptomyces bellus]
MSGVRKQSRDPAPDPTSEMIQAGIGKRLDDVAKILAGALVAVTGLMTALGLRSEFVFVALNNESWPIYVASLCAIVAIVCSIVALLIHPTRRGNLWETAVLVLGVVFYMVALSVAVIGAAKAAGGNGRPSITDVRVDGSRSSLRLSFDIRADGVETWSSIGVYVAAETADGEPVDEGVDLYSSSLRPNDEGVVEQRISIPLSPPPQAEAIHIIALNAGDGTNDECETRRQQGPACTTYLLP